MIALVLWLFLAAAASALDSEFSEAQEGVRIRVLGLDRDLPRLRIENQGGLTLALRNNLHLAAAFFDGGERLRRSRPTSPMPVDRITITGSDQLTIVLPGVSIELPLYRFYFDDGDEGAGEILPWVEGLTGLPSGSHRLRLISNGLGFTVIDVNGSPFHDRWTIPDLDFTVR